LAIAATSGVKKALAVTEGFYHVKRQIGRFPLTVRAIGRHWHRVAVHVRFDAKEIDALLEPFGVGHVRSVRGLAEGSINTNHRVEAEGGVFFVRLSFGRGPEDLAFEASLLDWLAAVPFPVVAPRRTAAGEPALPCRNGFLSIFPWSAGEHLTSAAVEERHLWELGRILGRLRRIGTAFPLVRANPYGPATVATWLEELEATGGRGEVEVASSLPVLRRGLELARGLTLSSQGLVHGDIFRDNVLWLGDRIAALLDFEMACVAPAALDPAVTLLDWTWDRTGFSPARVGALADGYRREAGPEAAAAPEIAPALAFAACRFTLSRLRDFHFSPLPPQALVRKDWREMRARLEAALTLGELGVRRLWRQ
jgi:homoserine kinase type II